MIDLNTAGKAAEVAEAVFEKKFEEINKKIADFSGTINNIIWGVAVASLLLFISLVVSVIIFMAEMRSSYFQTQDTVNNRINELIQSNQELKTELLREVDKTADKQDYLERNILNRMPTK